jgi:hypothetical protein
MRNVSEINSFQFPLFGITYLVYCINWVRAKACVDQWEEEQILVKNEMEWTMLWF